MNQSTLLVVSITNSVAWSGLRGPGFFFAGDSFLGSCSVGIVGGVSFNISRSSSCSVAIWSRISGLRTTMDTCVRMLF